MAPIGAVGEILIEGPILARQYLNCPDLTTAQFITVPWLPPSRRVYRSGDYAYQDAQGRFHFHGRRDAQVKVNGQRVDLGEIEKGLASSHNDIHQAATVIFHRQLKVVGRNCPDVRLAAFVVFADLASPHGGENELSPIVMADGLRERMWSIRKHLQRVLPRHMIPSVYLPMASLPKTKTLKLDRRALSTILESLVEQDLQSFTLSYERDKLERTASHEPRNDIESTLLRHWTKALGLSESSHGGINGNFFDLGGDSISAMHFTWLVGGDGLHLSVSQVYAHPTISELGEFLADKGPKSHEASANGEGKIPLPLSLVTQVEISAVLDEVRCLGLAVEDVEDIYPATATQFGMLLDTEQKKETWVARDVWELPFDLDQERLRAAWESVVQRNPILRTRIVPVSTASCQAYQVVLHHRVASAAWNNGSRVYEMGFGRPLSIHRIHSREFEWIRHHAACK